MKIIDYELKGNVVRFYLGKSTLTNYYGDDWDDAPYDSNAGCVYSEYIAGTADIAFPFDALVLEPCTGEFNCSHTKDDMKHKTVPCVIVIPPEVAKTSYMTNFSYWASCKDALRFYFEDRMEPTEGLVTYYFDPVQRRFTLQQETQCVTRMIDVNTSTEGSDSMKNVPIWEKENLTLPEAAAYFGIGQNKIRELTERRNCDFVLFVGNKRLIKRKKFAKYLENAFSV